MESASSTIRVDLSRMRLAAEAVITENGLFEKVGAGGRDYLREQTSQDSPMR